jgi:23S rRNA U2552 (ribose-2'-O)-methylase RlmE/FtsJ
MKFPIRGVEILKGVPNRGLDLLQIDINQQENTMAKITIDDKEYETDDMSEEAKAQLQSLQYVDNELQRVQLKTAALQTARNAYAKALQEALEQV